MKLSCVTASYVMHLLRYPGHFDWGLATRTIEQAPLLETIDDMLERLAPARLDGMEFWLPHTSARRLTPALATAIRRRLGARGMICPASAGGLGDPAQDPQAAAEPFQVACMLGAPLIAAHLPASTVPALVPYCQHYGVRIAFENGGESVDGIKAAVQEGGEWVGVGLDTGNLASAGGDAVQAVRELGHKIIHIHFKDVSSVGAHECVGLGQGIVDVRGVVRELKTIDYDGWLSIEIETSTHDPSEEIIASAQWLRELWG